MSLTKKVSPLLGLALAGMFVLSGCSSAATVEDTNSAGNPPVSNGSGTSSDASGKYFDLSVDDPRAQTFISQFTSTYPELTDGKTEKHILRNAGKLCDEIAYQQDSTQHTMTLEEMKSYVKPRVTGGNVMREATDAEADGIVRLAVTTVCTEHASLVG